MPGGRLGCLDSIEAYISDQCGAPRVCGLTNLGTVSFNRVLDDISEAVVTIPISTGVSTTKPCCDCLDLIEPWCHELHIIRNGVEVWTGPIVRITYGYTQVTIEAKDVIAWLQVRVPQGVLDNTATPMEITDLALDVLETAFSEHDPCVLDYVVQTDLNRRPTDFANTAVSPQTGFPAFEGTVFDWLENLSEIGLDYTVLGRSIILGVEDFELPALGRLTDEHILGELEVSKDGYSMTNRVFMRYQDDDVVAQCAAQNPDIVVPPCPALSDVPKICYGPIERLFEDAVSFNYTTAKQAADAYTSAGSPAPRTVNFPQGTRLAPDTPWELNDMIPGQNIFVSLGNLCLDVNQAFRLLEVNYSLEVGGDEEISVSLGAFNEIGDGL